MQVLRTGLEQAARPAAALPGAIDQPVVAEARRRREPGRRARLDRAADARRLGGALLQPAQVDEAGRAGADRRRLGGRPGAVAADGAGERREPHAIGPHRRPVVEAHPDGLLRAVGLGAQHDHGLPVVGPEPHPVAGAQAGAAADGGDLGLRRPAGPRLLRLGAEAHGRRAAVAGPVALRGDPVLEHRARLVEGAREGRGRGLLRLAAGVPVGMRAGDARAVGGRHLRSGHRRLQTEQPEGSAAVAHGRIAALGHVHRVGGSAVGRLARERVKSRASANR